MPDAILAPVARDLEILQEAGVDGVLFCNEKDYPYQLKVGPEVAAAMAATVGRLRDRITVPFGVNLLWDPMASLAVARATGARFIREVLTGVYESDLGIIQPNIGDISAYRVAIGAADVALFDNISPEFSSPLGHTLRGRSGPRRGLPGHGRDPDQRLGRRQPHGHGRISWRPRRRRPRLRSSPIRASCADRIAEIMKVADGAIVGTSLKVDGITWNPVDPKRARA